MNQDADARYVYGPYSRRPYPADRGYPAYTYPRQTDDRATRMVLSAHHYGNTLEPNSLRSVLAQNTASSEFTRTGMKPYVFRHYVPPTYYELWDYNLEDIQAAHYNEILRERTAGEIKQLRPLYRAT